MILYHGIIRDRLELMTMRKWEIELSVANFIERKREEKKEKAKRR